jgi:hypothetical protein
VILVTDQVDGRLKNGTMLRSSDRVAFSRKTGCKMDTGLVSSTSAPYARVPLRPHRYPAWLVASGIAIAIATAYSVVLLPSYLHAFYAVRRAEAAQAQGDRALAERSLLEALRFVPSSKETRIELAIVLFQDPSEEVQRRGLDYLYGLTVDNQEWKSITAAVPKKLRDYLQLMRQ